MRWSLPKTCKNRANRETQGASSEKTYYAELEKFVMRCALGSSCGRLVSRCLRRARAPAKARGIRCGTSYSMFKVRSIFEICGRYARRPLSRTAYQSVSNGLVRSVYRQKAKRRQIVVCTVANLSIGGQHIRSVSPRRETLRDFASRRWNRVAEAAFC